MLAQFGVMSIRTGMSMVQESSWLTIALVVGVEKKKDSLVWIY